MQRSLELSSSDAFMMLEINESKVIPFVNSSVTVSKIKICFSLIRITWEPRLRLYANRNGAFFSRTCAVDKSTSSSSMSLLVSEPG